MNATSDPGTDLTPAETREIRLALDRHIDELARQYALTSGWRGRSLKNTGEILSEISASARAYVKVSDDRDSLDEWVASFRKTRRKTIKMALALDGREC